jgi:polar amino acid transport system substrate-binding protein
MLNRLLLALLLTLSAGSMTAIGADKSISLMVSSWSPYVNKELPGQGVAVELVNEIFAHAGYQTKVTIAPWQRAVEGVEVGLYDALGTAWYSEQRAEALIFSEPYLENDLLLLKLRSLPGDYLELSHLQGRRVGVSAAYEYGIDFAAIPGLTLVAENHDIQSLLNLLNRKVDFVLGDRRALVAQLDEFLAGQKGQLMEVPMQLPGRPLYVAASRSAANGQEIIDAFNKALAEARRDGSYKEIVERWNAEFLMQR